MHKIFAILQQNTYYMQSPPLKNAALNDVYVLTYRYYTILYKFNSFLLKNSWQFIGTIGVVVLIICTKRDKKLRQQYQIVGAIKVFAELVMQDANFFFSKQQSCYWCSIFLLCQKNLTNGSVCTLLYKIFMESISKQKQKNEIWYVLLQGGRNR